MTDTRTLLLMKQFERLPMPSEPQPPVDPDEIRQKLPVPETEHQSEAI